MSTTTSPDTPHPALPTAQPVMAERVGDGLLLRTAWDKPEPLWDFLRQLPTEPQRCVILVTGAAGLSTGFPDALVTALAGRRVPVRLVMLGPFPATASTIDALRYLAGLLGVPVTAPVTPLVPGAEPGPLWLTSRPNQAEYYEPRWPMATVAEPEPAYARPPAGASQVDPAGASQVDGVAEHPAVAGPPAALAPPAEPAPAPVGTPPPAEEPASPVVPPSPDAVPVPERLHTLLGRRDWPHAAAQAARPAPVAPPADPASPATPPLVTGAPTPSAPRAETAPVPPMDPPDAVTPAVHPDASAHLDPPGHPDTTGPTVAVSTATAPGRTPVWIDHRAWREEDRAALRTTLNGRYDAHFRVVTKTLAEEPGLRVAGASPDLVAGLVALRAYCADDRDEVNRLLRTGAGDERAAVLARGAACGLRCLPTVLGPVFRPGRIDAGVLAAYQPGRVLAEPGLLDAWIPPASVPDATVQFVIWSVSARRVGRLGLDGPAAALFPPASRFTVLAVDRPDDAAGLPRVLLCDVTGGAQGGPVGGHTDRVLSRMRAASRTTTDLTLSGAYVTAVPGLDDTGHPYPERESQ
ncbi:hypothetical protein [Micromonospora sp. WMMD1082]|uniref:hypothetical protein n=1 Tax=Micromonospora sp. WMMD1082 TaxID=3016104 RepID=UPI002415F41F|nr:hypothetical protein [Micromonospora sp. WMMD1082]MDG4795737.1 hypothetical protein [Micromonospora sp. WMMD1082]